VTVHVLPAGDPEQPRFDDLSQYRYRGFERIDRRIAHAYHATADYLAGQA